LGKPEGKRPLGRQRHKWLDNIKMDLGEIRWGGVDWTGLVQNRDQWRALVNSVTNRLVLLNAGKFFNSCTTGGLTTTVHWCLYTDSVQQEFQKWNFNRFISGDVGSHSVDLIDSTAA
jgi:hypothetical protein